jgi:hypothetical protein
MPVSAWFLLRADERNLARELVQFDGGLPTAPYEARSSDNPHSSLGTRFFRAVARNVDVDRNVLQIAGRSFNHQLFAGSES